MIHRSFLQRYPAESLALAGAALIGALHALPRAAAALEYRWDAFTTEPWRLLGAHLVHVNGRHALVNALAWITCAHLFAPELGARRQAIALVAGALAIDCGLAAFYPQVAWYRGASGALHALFLAGAVTWLVACTRDPGRRSARGLALPLALTAGGWIKIIAELPAGADLTYSSWLAVPVVAQAHLLGAAAGTACGLAFALPGRPPEPGRRAPNTLPTEPS